MAMVMTVSTRGRRTRRSRGRVSLAFMALGWLLLLASGARAAGPEVVLLPTTGIVDEGMSKYLADNIALAGERGAAAVVIKLNTPGGSLAATQDITATILEAPLPVIVWVAPAGGMAASAGTFITLSGNIALMAPATIIGAASPVSGTGEEIPETERKKLFEAVSNMAQSLAERRGRPVEWAVSTVTDATAYTANEAVEAGAVDGIASSIQDVLDFADGRTVEVGGADVVLDLADATVTEQAMNPLLAIIRIISDPTIAFLLFTMGSTGLLVELYAPNFVTGILGALMLLLGLIGLGTLPLNVGGLLLILFGLVLFGLELTVTSHGLLGFGGVVCLALGASALFTGPTDPFEPVFRVAPVVILVVTATAAAFMGMIVIGAIRSRSVGNAPGALSISVGATGRVDRDISPVGSVYVSKEQWSARSSDGSPIDRGTNVRVVGIDGLTLVVEPDASSSKPA